MGARPVRFAGENPDVRGRPDRRCVSGRARFRSFPMPPRRERPGPIGRTRRRLRLTLAPYFGDHPAAMRLSTLRIPDETEHEVVLRACKVARVDGR